MTVATPIAVTASRAYRAVTEEVGAWWDNDHTFSGNATNLSIEAKLGGCFCESLPSGGGIRHMTVVYADPGKLLRMSGGLGPLQSLAVTGTMTWTFTDTNGTARVEVTYNLGGFAAGPDGVGAFARPVDAVLTAQVTRLKNFLERGR